MAKNNWQGSFQPVIHFYQMEGNFIMPKENEKKKEERQGISTIKKITAKTVCGVVRDIPAGFLYRVIGQAHGTKIVRTTYGDSVGLKGKFLAINHKGQKFMSGIVYLPEAVTIPIEAELKGNPDAAVQFAYDVTKKLDDTTAIGYVYEVIALIEPAESDLLEVLSKDLPALPV